MFHTRLFRTKYESRKRVNIKKFHLTRTYLELGEHKKTTGVGQVILCRVRWLSIVIVQ